MIFPHTRIGKLLVAVLLALIGLFPSACHLYGCSIKERYFFSGSAITALGIRKAVIRNNNIRMSVPSAAYPNINVYGIRAFGSPEVEIDDNSMESLTQTDMRVRGIWVENSPEAFVKCNDIHRYAQHLTFSGSCPNTEMWQNTLD